MNILVLGGGLVGSAIARDLAKDKDFSITVADRSTASLDRCRRHGLAVTQADLADEGVLDTLLAGADLVIGAVPGFMGFNTLKRAILAGKNVVDIAFFPEDPFELDALAREHHVTAVVDCGLAPGLGNILYGRLNEELDSIDTFLCLVGGLPVVRRKPYEYAAVFSPIDVIEEYTRPARFIERGALVVRPALSEVEEVDLPGVGTLEAFNSDGLRTLAVTMNAPNMKEKTLRYPGHVALMRAMRDTGFFSKEVVEVNGVSVVPLDVTARLLFPAWELREGERDLSVMRVEIFGEKGGKTERHVFDLLDHYDTETHTTSMARTTGYTCAVAARLVANGTYRRIGISPPEYLGAEKTVYDALLQGLTDRGIQFSHSVHPS
ncbi:MAG: saccharopine dehydrogenase NADP-binding domain-containing protein [Bacteroidia bacterium]|nr:saccharopine dehydrogenase NADP-binding domain-containing protein [Bacteroidia bacterium]